jgi:predicted DNA-binding protein
MKKTTCITINQEVWEDLKIVAVIKSKTRGEILDSLIKKELKENEQAIRQFKEIQVNN